MTDEEIRAENEKKYWLSLAFRDRGLPRSAFRAAWVGKDGNDDHGRGDGHSPHKEGDRVIVKAGHWNKSLVGRVGIVHSTAKSAAGEATHYVKGLYGAGGGEFVLASDLGKA